MKWSDLYKWAETKRGLSGNLQIGLFDFGGEEVMLHAGELLRHDEGMRQILQDKEIRQPEKVLTLKQETYHA